MNSENDFKLLRKLKDQELLFRTENLVREERELLTKVLYHLKEIEKRRLFSSLGYKSIFDFATKKLGYSEDQAYRRIQAMRLLSEIPEIEEKINSGELNLTHLGLAQNLFKSEKKQNKEVSKAQKLEIFEKISSKPVREAESLLFSYSSSPETLKRDQIKSVSENHIELKFTASKELLEKIETLKGYLAHTDPNISMGELLEKLCNLGLENFAPSKRGLKSVGSEVRSKTEASKDVKAKTVADDRIRKSKVACEDVKAKKVADGKIGKCKVAGEDVKIKTVADGRAVKTKTVAPLSAASRKSCVKENYDLETYLKENSKLRGKYISLKTRRRVFEDARNKCQICQSTYSLEIDHIRPKALGGTNEPKNLRVLCRPCNQRQAAEKMGIRVMQKFFG